MSDATPPEGGATALTVEQLKEAKKEVGLLQSAWELFAGSDPKDYSGTIEGTKQVQRGVGALGGASIKSSKDVDKLKASVDSIGSGLMSFDKLSQVLEGVGGEAAKAAKRMAASFEANKEDFNEFFKNSYTRCCCSYGTSRRRCCAEIC